MAFLQLQGLTKRYDGIVALDDVTMDVRENEYVTLLGPSGSGKTTLLRAISGFEIADAGSITLGDRAITRTPAHRREIGFVFQNFGLFPHLSVFDNVAFGLRFREVGAVRSTKEISDRVHRMLNLVGLEGLAQRGVNQISGGQRQRVALARTLVTEPKITLLDEPLGALDANLRERMQFELRSIQRELGATFVHVTGNEHEALIMGDRTAVLDQGRILQYDDPKSLFERPASATVARFLSSYNLFPGRAEGGAFVAADARFPVSGDDSGSGNYAIRYDAMSVLDVHGAPATDDQVTLPATFMADEYSGSLMKYLFRTGSGTIVEVEEHLSHHAPSSLERGRSYTLGWKRDDALVFVGGSV